MRAVIGRLGPPAAVLGLLLLLGACSPSESASTSAPTPPPATLTTTPAPATTTGSAECANLVLNGQMLINTVTQFVQGQATGAQVRTAVTNLNSAIDALRSSASANLSAQLDQAKAALQRLQDALTARPPNFRAAGTAANDTLTALRGAADLCPSATTPTSLPSLPTTLPPLTTTG